MGGTKCINTNRLTVPLVDAVNMVIDSEWAILHNLPKLKKKSNIVDRTILLKISVSAADVNVILKKA